MSVVIIGAGPAGLALGCHLAQADVPCLIVERANHPRPHVGESLMPSAIREMRAIGFLETVEGAGFPRSRGVAYHAAAQKQVEIAYAEFPLEGIDQDYTYHVDRGKFDLLLMKYAEATGCRVVQGITVQTVLFDDEGAACGVRGSFGGQTVDIPATVVVDAAGRATRIGRQLALRHEHPVFDQFALHAWFVDVDRGKHRTDAYTHIYFVPDLRGWAWQAPIDADITSIGLVADKRAYQDSDLDVEQFFLRGLGLNPQLSKAMDGSTLINDIKGETNYSYHLDQVCGDGWLAIGDAARFLDPIFSSGVSVAMRSAREAAEILVPALARGDVSRSAFLPYEDKVQADSAIWDDFIRLFYRLLPSFTHLLESDEYREPLLRMIQGELDADSEPALLGEMRDLISAVEEADTHPWKGDLFELPTA